MTEKGGLLRRPKLRLVDADVAMLDRVRPERSFQQPGLADREPDETLDDISKLERLGALRERGLLTDEEFRAAKARLLGQKPA
jgi:Short C-terminal domain